MSYEISLQSILSSRDINLFNRLGEIQSKSDRLLVYTAGKFPYYTPHDFHHSLAVEDNLNWLIPDKVKEKMNPYEIFFLVVASWLHDWGMIGTEDEEPLRVRELHNIRTQEYFETRYHEINLDEHEASIVGKICKGHRKTNLYTPEYDEIHFKQNNRIRLNLLSAILRVADECDITFNRTPEIIYNTINPTDKSEEEFKKHLAIVGVGQFDEKHKIIINAIAKDPKGARAIREVQRKIQEELDSVKSILSQNEIALDIIELRLETKGFIDKPIQFEINKEKIIDILIGDHLYGSPDAAIREIVQNAIDACKFKLLQYPTHPCEIIITKTIDGNLIIEDNGIGMSFEEAKNFLSSIGSSLFASDKFKEKISNDEFIPISKFGIGVLSYFLISNNFYIETYKEDSEPCKFTINAAGQAWRYEKGSRNSSGTLIFLNLNKEGIDLDIISSLKKYFAFSSIPVTFKDNDSSIFSLQTTWDFNYLCKEFIKPRFRDNKVTIGLTYTIETDEFDVFVVSQNIPFFTKSYIFNNGIYVCNTDIRGLNYNCILCINIKKDLVNLQISRDNIKEDEKFNKFVYSLTTSILNEIKSKNENNPLGIIKILADLTRPATLTALEDGIEPKTVLARFQFWESFIDNAIFPIITKDSIKYCQLKDINITSNTKLYSCTTSSVLEEASLIAKLIPGSIVVVNPYSLLDLEFKSGKNTDIFRYLLTHDIACDYLDLQTIIIDRTEIVQLNYPELIPLNTKFSNFDTLFSPFLAIEKQPKIRVTEVSLTSEIICELCLTSCLIENKRLSDIISSATNDFLFGDNTSIEVTQEPIVILNLNDVFINAIFQKISEVKELDGTLSLKIKKYLKYLSFIPLALSHKCSFLFYFDILDSLECDIALNLSIDQPEPALHRMQKMSDVYFRHLSSVGFRWDLNN